MPTFQPPLTHVSAVPIPQSTGNSVRYLHLTFALTFEEHEDRSGSWEIWSNIPELQSTPGEWRALTFESEGMASEASSAGEAARSTSTRLTRQMSLIAERGQTFEYTFRHVLESGEIVWLGDGAHNGKLELVADQRGPVEDGRPEIDLDIISWEGIGLELSSTHPNFGIPCLHRLPSVQATSADLLILRVILPVKTLPFALLSTEKLATRASAPSAQLVICNPSLESIDIGAGACLPHRDFRSNQAYGEGTDVVELISQVLANSSSPNVDLAILNTTTTAAAMNGDCLCLHVQPSASSCEDKSYLFLYYTAETPGLLNIELPANRFTGSPLVLQKPDDTCHYLYVDKESSASPAWINLRLSGTATQVLRLDQFIELRGNGDDSPIWLCGANAIASEVGEEELDPPVAEIVLVPDVLSAPPDLVTQQSEEKHNTPAPSESSHRGQDHDEWQEEEREDQAPNDGWWIYSIIGPILARIWSWLFGGPAEGGIRLPNDDADPRNPEESVDEDEDVFATQTPADAHAPLVASPTLSRSTSDFSPDQSPSSTLTVKPLPQPSALIDRSRQTLVDDDRQDSKTVRPIHRVQIRSWASFTFSKPMFTFLLPPGTAQDAERLRFSYQRKGDKNLLSTTPTVIEHDNDCVQLILAAAGAPDGQAWEVQVERVD